ncbi:MAG: hypothetical protein U5K36_06025 [Roseovarius sp.]|nr:hypothetical protein [Roseovarius sp.]
MATARSARCSRSPNCPAGGRVSALVSASVGGLETLFVADSGTGADPRRSPWRATPASTATPQGPGGGVGSDGPTLLAMAETAGGSRLLALDQVTGVLHAFDMDGAPARSRPVGGSTALTAFRWPIPRRWR